MSSNGRRSRQKAKRTGDRRLARQRVVQLANRHIILAQRKFGSEYGRLINMRSINRGVRIIRAWSGTIDKNEQLLQEAGFNAHGKHYRRGRQ